jgi:tetratricopeptide (TPR) repeat protein
VSALLLLAVVAPLLAEGDAHYARRAEGAAGTLARPAEIDQALASYRAALAADPSSPSARWRLMRALYFRASYCGATADQARPLREEAKRVGEEAVVALEKSLGDPRGAARLDALRARPEAVPLYFWAAVSWGEWALARGTFAAARSGAAGRVRDLGQTVLDLDPAFEQGGGDRILGRLHSESPHIILVTGWVSREKAVQHLTHALALGPQNTVNQLFLAEALLDHFPGRTEEARRLLQACAQATPRPEFAVEDAVFIEQARARLRALDAGRRDE